MNNVGEIFLRKFFILNPDIFGMVNKMKYIITILILSTLLSLTACGNNEIQTGGLPTDITANTAADTTVSATETTAEITTEKPKKEFFSVVRITDDNWETAIVSIKYRLPDGYMPKLANVIDTSPRQLDERVAPRYREMYEAALKDGCKLTPYSGYRSAERQKINYENKVALYKNQGNSQAEAERLAAEWILPPGASEHNMGVAMDIVCTDESFDQTKEFKWLSENAAEYGFILRYPKDKTDITKVAYEPWHWRYVGREEALKIKASGKCLEEYLGIYND